MPAKKFDPYRLDRTLMKAAAAETAVMRGAPELYAQRLAVKLAEFAGRRYCVLTSSGREALRLAAAALLPRGGRAAFPDVTHPSLAEAVSGAGFRPEPLDIDLSTLNLSERALKAAAQRLDLLLLPHMFGTPAPVKLAERLARGRGFALVEDASQIIGGSLGRRRFGSFGDISVFSLSPYKPVSSPFCRAGALLCDSAALFKKILAMRPAAPKPEAYPFISIKLDRIENTLAGIKAANACYRRELGAALAYLPSGISDLTQDLPLLVPDKAAVERAFRKAGVPLERVYVPLHLEKGLPGKFTAADAYGAEAVHLPAWPLMTEAECGRAAHIARKAIEK